MKEPVTSCRAFLESDPSEQSPEESRALHALLLDQLPVGVFQKDREGRFVFVNSWFCHFRKATPDQFLGKTAQEVTAGKWVSEDAEQTEQLRKVQLLNEGASHHQLIMQTGQSIESEESYADAVGREHHLHAIKGPLIGLDGAKRRRPNWPPSGTCWGRC